MVRKISVLLLVLALVFTVVLAQGPAKEPPLLTITTVAAGGSLLYLSDGTTFEVKEAHSRRAASWPKKVPIGIYGGATGDYPYLLVLRPGKADGELVYARQISLYPYGIGRAPNFPTFPGGGS